LAERRTVDPNVAGSSPAGGILLLQNEKIFELMGENYLKL
jgi:hypothetical protein